MACERTATTNALIALLRIVDLGIDARRTLTSTQLVALPRWRARDEDLGRTIVRSEVARLAEYVVALDEHDEQLADNPTWVTELRPQHC